MLGLAFERARVRTVRPRGSVVAFWGRLFRARGIVGNCDCGPGGGEVGFRWGFDGMSIDVLFVREKEAEVKKVVNLGNGRAGVLCGTAGARKEAN